MGFALERFIERVDEEFICVICSLVLENPVQATCEHIFCNQCLNEWLATTKTCPVCRCYLQENAKPAARYFRNLLDKLEIKCDHELNGCQIFVKLEKLADHIANQCKYNPNKQVICDKGCNMTITLFEYEVNNCFSHFSNALKKLQDKQDEQAKIINSLRWQICHNMDISMNDPHTMVYKQSNKKGDIAMVQSIRPLTPDNTSFKIEILDRGEENFVTIGLTRKGYHIKREPGWCDGSIGYHGDDGRLFIGSGIGEKFGPKWQNGDIIECGVNFPCDIDSLFIRNAPVQVYFSRNKQLVGERQMYMPKFGLFPTFTIGSKGGKVRYFDS